MPLPKGFRKDLSPKKGKIGPARRQEILDDIADKGTFLPRGVYYEDMDKSFLEFVDKKLEITIDGEKVPVLFLTIQRWSEFSKTWQFSDKYKNIKLPFITIVRRPDIQVGTNQAGKYNIPGRRTYTYIKVPTNKGGRIGMDTYKIPQPTSVDVTYEVRLFCNRMRDLNKFSKDVQINFQSRQYYISPNGHPMPVHLEAIGDESQIDDFENRRFYVQLYEMKLLGYLLDEEEFKVIPTIDRSLLVTEVVEQTIKPRFTVAADKDNGQATFNVIFKPKSEPNFSTRLEFDIRFIDVVNIKNLKSLKFKLNGNLVTVPFVGENGDTLEILISKDFDKTGSFQMIGNLI